MDCLAFGDLVIGRKLQDRLVGAVVKREHAVVVALRDWIELVVMTAGAAQREPEKDAAGGVHAVRDSFHAKLLLVDTSFLIEGGIAVKPGRDLLLDRGVRH